MHPTPSVFVHSLIPHITTYKSPYQLEFLYRKHSIWGEKASVWWARFSALALEWRLWLLLGPGLLYMSMLQRFHEGRAEDLEEWSGNITMICFYMKEEFFMLKLIFSKVRWWWHSRRYSYTSLCFAVLTPKSILSSRCYLDRSGIGFLLATQPPSLLNCNNCGLSDCIWASMISQRDLMILYRWRAWSLQTWIIGLSSFVSG